MKVSLLRHLGLTVCVGLAGFVAPAAAQLSSASVTGVVRDMTGGVVPMASITLHNIDTGVERSSLTNSVGNYVFVDIQPGNYTLAASKTGFSSSRVNAFTLAVNQTATFDVVLQIGGVSQILSVEAHGDLVEASTAELGGVVARKQVNDLPLNGRNFTQLLSLLPGVSPITVSATTQTIIAQGSAFVFPSVNGQGNQSNYFMIDGINNENSYRGTYVVSPIIDSIQEFKINSHNDQAQFGSVLGGVVNVVSKTGTNELHGSAWEYVRNDAFDARNTFLTSVTPYRQNQFGISAGGPVLVPHVYNGRNKSFFFAAYEGFRYRQQSETLYTVPTQAELNGDLSAISTPIFNPYSTRPNPAQPGGFIRDPFPGNQIPASLIDPSMLAFAKATLPLPINTGVKNINAIDNTPIAQNQDSYTVRFDQNLGQKDSLWFRYTATADNTTTSGGRPEIGETLGNSGTNYGVSWVHTFSPSLILQAQYGRPHLTSNQNTYFRDLPANFIQSLGFSDSFVGNFVTGQTYLPALNVTNFFSGGDLVKDFPNATDIHQAKASVTKVVGNHTLSFGGELASNGYAQISLSDTVTFNPQQTANPANSAQIGNPLASFLLDVPDQFVRKNKPQADRWGGVMSYYFQDSWKATSRLTVNVGLRYDYTFIPPYGTEATIGKVNGIETGDMNFNNGTYVVQVLPPSCSVRGSAPCIPTPDGSLPAHVVVDPRGKIFHNTTTNWGPHAGLAFRLRADTVIRSSFGIFYDNWAAINLLAAEYSGSWPDVGQLSQNNLNVPVAAQPTPSLTALNPFPGGLLPPSTPFTQVETYVDPYMKNPYSMQWNFGIEHQFSKSTALTVNYVGSGTRRTELDGYYNTALTPGPGSPQSRALYPYITPTTYARSVGRSDYNALQLLFGRKYSSGVAYQVSYTWSKSIDNGQSGANGTDGYSVEDPYHYNNDRSVSAFDLPQVLTFNVVYDLPIGRGRRLLTGNRVIDYIVGNWQVNAITTLRSGQPYNITVAGDIANTGNVTYERANLVGNPNLANPTPQEWFNRSAFAIPAQYTFGNLGRDVLRTDGLFNLDASVFRQVTFRESRRIELRAEAFNLTNSVVYGTPISEMTSATFGEVTSLANSPRKLQLGLKVIF